MSVWAVVEVEDGAVSEPSLEVLGEAAGLARPARSGAIAVDVAEAEAALSAVAPYGPGRIVLLVRSEPGRTPEADAALVSRWLAADAGSKDDPLIVLLSHTRAGRAMAPVLAAALDAAVAPDAVGVRCTPSVGLEITRPAYGERLYATLDVPPGTPAVVTLRPGAIGVGPPEAGRRVLVERHLTTELRPIRTGQPRQVLAADVRTVDLRDAERIVAGGRGLGGPDGVVLLQELADLLGAAVGGSRVAVDLGWLPWERQIGLSGRVVAPQLYFACGISGASQHLTGIQGAKTIVAINVDRQAPIFAVAELGAVGDWRAIVTALITRLRVRRGANPASTSAKAGR